MFEWMKPYLFTFLLISGGVISIAFSAWQYQVVGDDDIIFYMYPNGDEVNFDYVCNHFPWNWMRPFRLTAEGQSDSLCGYSTANTGYRFALAISTILCGIWLIFYKDKENTKLITYWGLFGIMLFWLAASVADIIAVIQGGKSCRQGMAVYSNGFLDCDSAEYGITVAIDVLMCLVMFACWLLAGPDLASATPKAGAVPTANAMNLDRM